jgi:hypothetical protein
MFRAAPTRSRDERASQRADRFLAYLGQCGCHIILGVERMWGQLASSKVRMNSGNATNRNRLIFWVRQSVRRAIGIVEFCAMA